MNPRVPWAWAVVLAAFVGCVAVGLARRGKASTIAKGKRPLIGFSVDTLKEERWQHDRDFFVGRANELGADVLVQAANSDDTRQLRDVESMITAKIEALVIVPHDGAAMAKAVRVAHEADVPVIAYDRIVNDSDLDLYIAFDAVRIGEMQAKFLVDKLKPGSKMRIVRINGAKTDNNSFLLRRGQDAVLKPHLARGAMEIVHDDWAQEWKPENAKKIVNAAITRLGNKFDAVLAANDGTAGGAIQALLEDGLAGKILVTGGDAELAACQRVVAGTQSMTVYMPIRDLARRAAEIALRLAAKRHVVATSVEDNGKVKVPSIAIDSVTLTKENMDVVVKAGYLKYDEIYRDVPAAQRPPRP
ncbi:MAG: substrate-binding domain-containing protein [Elusimicrobia bacterium]|nr:substrate-binding domain-containing protein [Elusimicrobiota bacterium]